MYSTMQLKLLFVIAFLCLGFNSLQSQCITPNKHFYSKGEGLFFLIEKGKIDKWIKEWSKNAQKRNFDKVRPNFRCQTEEVLDKLTLDMKQDFANKNSVSLKKRKIQYESILQLVKLKDTQFHAHTAKDYIKTHEYLNYITLVEQYSLESKAQKYELEAQLYSALTNLLDKSKFATKNGDEQLAKTASTAYAKLLDEANSVSAFLGDDIANRIPSKYTNQYTDMKCLLSKAKAMKAFNKKQYVQAVNYLQCNAPSVEQLSATLKQQFVDTYISQLDKKLENSRLKAAVNTVQEIDSLTVEFAKIGVNVLPCPTKYQRQSNCYFYELIDEYRENLIASLEDKANDKYSTKAFAETFILLDKAILISYKAKQKELRELRDDWFNTALEGLETRRAKHIEEKNWEKAISAINRIKKFHPQYRDKDKVKEVRVNQHIHLAREAAKNQDWLKALEEISKAKEIGGSIECSNCISISEINDFKDNAITQLELKMDKLNEQNKNLNAALDLVDKIVIIYPEYPRDSMKNRLQCIYYNELGINNQKSGDCNSTFDAFDKALSFCRKTTNCNDCENEERLKQEIRGEIECIIIEILEKAKNAYDNLDYISACELTLEAKRWVNNSYNYQISKSFRYKYPQEYQYIVDYACVKASKRAKIVIRQSANNKFDEYTFSKLARTVKNNIQNELRNTHYGKFIDIVESNADFLLVVDISNIFYQFSYDNTPKIDYYCTFRKDGIVTVNYKPVIYQWVHSSTIPVSKYIDKADGKVDYYSYTKDLRRGTKYQGSNKQVNESWAQEAWETGIDIDYLAYCDLRRGNPIFLNNEDRTYFSKTRRPPSKHELLLEPLYSSLSKNATDWARMLSSMMNS